MFVSNQVVDKLVGESNETTTSLEEYLCQALLDTGSMVSTVGDIYYEENLSHLPVHPLGDIIIQV